MAQLNRTQTILRNIVCNWLGYIVQAAVVFFLTPFVLRELGDARYGVWALITSVTGTYGLLAFGLQGGVNQYLTRYLANRDYQKMNEVASTATAVLSLVGLAILLVSLIIAALFPYIFDVPENLTREVRLCTVIVGASVAVQMGLFVFSSAFMATQRYDLSNAIGIAGRLLNAGLVLVVLKLGYGLVGVSVATTASNIVDYLMRLRVAYRIIPELTINRSLVTMPVFREMVHYGAWSFVGTIAQAIHANSPAIVIGAMMPIHLMAPYALAAGLVRQLDSLLGPIIMVFFPVFTELHSRGERETMRSVYLSGSRMFVVLMVCAAVISGVFAETFFGLWVGPRYIEGVEFPSVALLYQAMVAGMVCRHLPGVGSQVLLGTLNVRELTITYLVEAVVNLISTIVLVRYYGLVGAAFGALLAGVLSRTFVVPILVGKLLKVPLATFAKHVWLRPMIVGACVAGLGSWAESANSADSFGELIFWGGCVGVGSVVIAAIIGLTSDDRRRVLSSRFISRGQQSPTVGHAR